MNVNDLINNIRSGVYGDYTTFGGFPEEQLNLLRAADAYYKYRYNTLVSTEIDPESEKPLWRNEADITVTITTEGTTNSNFGVFTVTLPPPGGNGFNGVPVAGISDWKNSTFLIYDSALGLVHELGHVILGLLGLKSTSEELMLAALANIATEAGVASISAASSPDDLVAFAKKVRSPYGFTMDAQYGSANPPDRLDLLTRANLANSSYENIFNQARGFYTLAGIDPANIPAASAYRTGYVTHLESSASSQRVRPLPCTKKNGFRHDYLFLEYVGVAP